LPYYFPARHDFGPLHAALRERQRIHGEMAAEAQRRVSGEQLDVPGRTGRPERSGRKEALSERIKALHVRTAGWGRPQSEAGTGRPRPLSDEREMERGGAPIVGVLLAGVCWLAIIASAFWFWGATQ
jgi:hypothetical protein